MTKLLIALFAATLAVPALPVTVSATADQNAPVAPAPQAPPAGPPMPPGPVQPSASQRQPTGVQTGNIQLDIVITDTQDGKPDRKTVSMLVRDGSRSSIRSSGAVAMPRPSEGPPVFNFKDVSLNLDARAGRIDSKHILVSATFEFSAAPPKSESQGVPSNLTQGIEVVVESGKTLLVSRSADPVSDRTVTVELTATIREP